MLKSFLFTIIIVLLIACQADEDIPTQKQQQQDTFVIYTQYSNLGNTYYGFNSPNAINRIADIENEYFNNFDDSISRYYGTLWAEFAAVDTPLNETKSILDKYKQDMQQKSIKPDSMHCTIYAIEALKAGLDTNFAELEKYHKQIWGNREHAGWSVGYILVKYFNWNAYLFISDYSNEYDRCVKNYKNSKKYYVWHQPDIPLSGIYDFDRDKSAIDSLLLQHEFGWGFSNQGIHTWITRFDTLKECIWTGSPAKKYNSMYNNYLFKKTKFTDFYDYASHVIIFPPKEE